MRRTAPDKAGTKWRTRAPSRGLRSAAAGLDGECRPPRVRGKLQNNFIAERDGPPRSGTASGGDARRAETQSGSVHEHAARGAKPRADAQRRLEFPQQCFDKFNGIGTQDFENMQQLDDIHTAFSALAFGDKRLRPAKPARKFVLA